MQTQLAPQYRDTPEGQQADRVLRSCVHCGFCNATCPTYKLTGNELDGPRGRIYLMKQVFEGHTPTQTTQAHLDRCIGCRHCESTCPSGVQYHELLSVGQAVVDAQVQRPMAQGLRRWLIRQVVPSRGFGPLLRLGRWMRPLLPNALAQHVPQALAHSPGDWPDASKCQHTRRVLMPQGCVQPHIRPHIDAATARVLDAVGVQAVPIRGAACCGALKGHLGDTQGASEQARRNIDAWWPFIEGESPVEAILINASGCGAWAKDYDQLLAQDPAYADKARRVVALIKDPAEMLTAWVPALRQALHPGQQQGQQARSLGSLTFQPPCSLGHAMKLSQAAKAGSIETGLRALGFEVTLASVDSHQCCGAGGAYSLLQPDLSAPLKAAKVAALMATKPQVVISANIGCITHLQADMPVPVRHWLEVLDDALKTKPC